MSERKFIVHRAIMIAALALAVAALPFSVKTCHAAIMLMLVGWLWEGHWRAKATVIHQSALLQLIIAFFFLSVLGIAFSDNPLSGWFSTEKKVFFLLVPVALATTAIKLNEKEIRSILLIFVLACFTGTLLCLLQAWNQTEMFLAGKGHINPYLASSSYHALNPLQSETWLIFSYVSLSEGIGIHPTYFALYLAVCIIFLIQTLPFLKSRLMGVVSFLLILYLSIFIVFLASRIVTLGLAVVLAVALVRTLMTKERAMAVRVVITSVVFAFVIFLNPVSRYRSLQEINLSTFRIEPGHEYQNAAHIRASLWWLALRTLSQSNPLSGVGTGNVENRMATSGKQYAITNIIHSFDPHNQYLYSSLANGYPGGCLLILCLWFPAYFAWLKKDYTALGFSFLFCLLCLTESALEMQKGIVFYALFSSLFFFQVNSFQTISFNLRSMSHERY